MNDLVFQHDFDRVHRTVALRDLLSLVSRRSNRLTSYREARRDSASGTVSYRGVRTVPIDRIVGSVDRFDDFDRGFRPRKRHSSGRWQRVARAHADGRDLPPVQLHEVGGDFYVEDGHHRVSVARLYGQQFIDAEVNGTATTMASVGAAPVRSNSVSQLAQRVRSLAVGFLISGSGPKRPQCPSILPSKGHKACTPIPCPSG